MPAVEAQSRTTVNRPLKKVAAYLCDLTHSSAWLQGVERVEWQTGPPREVGARIAVYTRINGKYPTVSTVVEYDLGTRISVRTSGKMPMTTTYSWTASGGNSTLVTMHRRGEWKVNALAPLVWKLAMGKRVAAELARLKLVLDQT